MPFFSIIIPVYNIAPYLRECLDSVMAQTFGDWEAICVDDGSTDGSGAILDEYAAKDSRFNVIHQTNAGVSAARNAALDVANGEWVWFVDGDDALRDCSLKEISAAVSVHPDANSVRIGHLKGDARPQEWPQDEELPSSFFSRPCDEGMLMFVGGMWSVVIRRRAIGNIRFEPFPRGEDTVFLFACARNGFGCIDINRSFYFYRQRSGSATRIPVTREIVEKNFACQRRQIENFVESVKLLGNPSVPRSWGFLFGICYRTYYGMYFRLPAKDRGRLIDKWTCNIDMLRKHYDPPFGIRIRIALIRFFRSGILVRWLVG